MARKKKSIFRTPYSKAVDVVTNYFKVIDTKGDELVKNYKNHIDNIRNNQNYRRDVGFRMLVGLASWYQSIEDVELSRKLAEIMAQARERYRDLYPIMEEQLAKKYGIELKRAPEEKVRKVMRIEIVS